MTTNNPTPQPAGEGGAPERVWLTLLDAEIQSEKVTREDIEYIRADLARATQPATAPSDLISRDIAMRTMCSRCANSERYGPPVSIEGSQCLFHFQITDGWNAGQCSAQAIKQLPSAATTPTDVAERARRAVEKMYKRGWISREVATNDTTKRRLADIIAAEFAGEN